MKVISSWFLISSLLLTTASLQAQPEVSVAHFQGGRQAAVSYTFDDGLLDQYTLAYPELRKRGLRATFAVIGSKVGGIVHSSQDRAMGISGTPCMTWAMLREMAEGGQEITSHGWEHKKVTKLTPEQLRYEVQHNDTVIFTETGHFPRSYVYPGNGRDSATIRFCEHDRVGSRLFQISIGAKRDSAWLSQWVEGLIERGEWGIGMTHGIATGYDHFPDPQVLWSHFDYIATRLEHVWVAPFCEVAAYVRERDDVKLTVSRRGRTTLVNVSTTLDSHIFNVPLTLQISDRPKRITQDRHKLNPYTKNGVTLVDINPHGGQIKIK